LEKELNSVDKDKEHLEAEIKALKADNEGLKTREALEGRNI
jgi:hypothetical protein